MDDAQITNLLGALSLSLADAQATAARRASGLSTSACAALVTLGAHAGLAIGDLAKVLGLTHSVTVRTVEALVAAGLVERRQGADRRQVLLGLTPTGARSRAAILEARDAVLAAALAPLEPDERSRLGGLIARVLADLTHGRREADHICRLCDENVCPGDTCPVECAAVRIESAGP